MPDNTIKTKIKDAIEKFAGGNLTENALNLFNVLGYNTERQAPLEEKTFEFFKENYIENKKFDDEKALAKDWKYVDLLFQLSKEEILKQTSLFDTRQVNRTIIEAYLFFVIELRENAKGYARTNLTQITREVNRLFPMPAMILFKYNRHLTLAVINRRLHKRDESKDVLEKVTLIKDILIPTKENDSTHRAHIEILFDLSFDEMNLEFQFSNFVELHNAWQKKLDTKELNKRFYNELFSWYLWAIRSVKFPNDVADDKDDTLYNSENVIRLLTRLIFVWFVKEKGLVPEMLFNKKSLSGVLKKFNPDAEDNSDYYKAILQNLFFATLNTEMPKDGGSREYLDEKKKNKKTGQTEEYMDHLAYRYQELFVDKAEALKIFENIPFLNGGLFECLDRTDPETKVETRIDGFSTKKHKQPTVPNILFFGKNDDLDLSAEFENGNRFRHTKVRGLICILDSYKFTIEENTPLEQEIALDPELLGKIFENLLASYNPETRTTARKQTGSYYTPREIVNYMVDESLIAFLKTKLLRNNPVHLELGSKQTSLLGNEAKKQLSLEEQTSPVSDPEKESVLENKLRELFAYEHEDNPFENDSKTANAIIKHLSDCKILDPACGSGAFPMGILHKIVLALGKIDPCNLSWKQAQLDKAKRDKERAKQFEDETLRQTALKSADEKIGYIEESFGKTGHELDYTRKLFLIENCIYGVDIQQIAVQISKLRFFISLMVDQTVDDSKPNRNILSLPNLETKFVAANTLIPIEKPQQLSIINMDESVKKAERELHEIRQRIFFTRKYSEKKKLKKEERTKRQELEKALIGSGFPEATAGQVSSWDPFDPLASAPFFDPEVMFAIEDDGNGRFFDVVIGNPPYVDIKALPNNEVREFFRIFKSAENRINLYSLFIEKAYSLLRQDGSLVFINPNSILVNESYWLIRNLIVDGVRQIIKLPDNVFEMTTVETIILQVENKKLKNKVLGLFFHNQDKIDFNNLKFNLFSRNIWKKDEDLRFNIFISTAINDLLGKINRLSKPLETYCLTSLGITPYDKYKGHTPEQIHNREFHATKKLDKTYVPLISGKNIHPFHISDEIDEYLKYGSWLGAPRERKFFEGPKIIVRQIVSRDLDIIAGYSEQPHYFTQIGFSLISKTEGKDILKIITALLNSKLVNFYHKNRFLDIEKIVFQKVLIANCKKLPIIIPENKDILVSTVNQIIDIIAADRTEYYKKLISQLDIVFYKLYTLTYDECQIIDPEIGKLISREDYERMGVEELAEYKIKSNDKE